MRLASKSKSEILAQPMRRLDVHWMH